MDILPMELQHKIFRKVPIKSIGASICVSKPWKSIIISSSFVKSYSKANKDISTNKLLVFEESARRLEFRHDNDATEHFKTLKVPFKLEDNFLPPLGFSKKGELFLQVFRDGPPTSIISLNIETRQEKNVATRKESFLSHGRVSYFMESLVLLDYPQAQSYGAADSASDSSDEDDPELDFDSDFDFENEDTSAYNKVNKLLRVEELEEVEDQLSVAQQSDDSLAVHFDREGFGLYKQLAIPYEVYSMTSGRFFHNVIVFSLNSNSWRICNSFSPKYDFFEQSLFFNGFIHWIAQIHGSYEILTFDVNSEEFRAIKLPDTVDGVRLTLSVYKDFTIALCNWGFHGFRHDIDIWVLTEYGQEDSWCRFWMIPIDIDLVHVNHPVPLGLRKNGELFLQESYDDDDEALDELPLSCGIIHSIDVETAESERVAVRNLNLRTTIVSSWPFNTIVVSYFEESMVLLDNPSARVFDSHV
ncbi:hypothetical protein ACFE04_022368 [Oxalis oulophora]